MERKHPIPESEARDKILHFLSLAPMKPKEQIVVNNELGIIICRTKSNLASINIACANGTEIRLPQKENHIFRPASEESNYTFFPIQLEKGKFAQIGNYNIRASISEKGIKLNIETYGPINIQPIYKKEDLRKVLSRPSSGDNQKPQLSKFQEPLHTSGS